MVLTPSPLTDWRTCLAGDDRLLVGRDRPGLGPAAGVREAGAVARVGGLEERELAEPGRAEWFRYITLYSRV